MIRAAGIAAALVLALWALAPTYPNYDAYYHLVWGRELLDGITPSFEAYAAPTPHPLYLGVSALLGVLGAGADRALVLLCLLAHAALVVGTFALGREVFGRLAGVLAAAFVAASASFLLYALRGYLDAPFLALVIWAGALEARGRRSWEPMALLVAAGLLRPEAWVLGGLYAVFKRRPALLAAAATAPVVWVAVDWAVTGDPLHSLNSTSELADDLGREQGLANVPSAFVSFLAATVRPPVAVLGILGGVAAVRLLGWHAVRVPLALFATGVATFAGTGLLGLSILPRYLTVPAVALCLFAGYALTGFTSLAAHDPRRARWRRASIAAGVLGVVGVALLAPSTARVREELRFIRATHEELVALLDEPRVREGRRCGPVTFPNYRLVPDARWHLDAPRAGVGARSARRRDRGVAIFVLTPKGLRRFGFADGASPSTNVPDPGFSPVARRGRFVAYVACP